MGPGRDYVFKVWLQNGVSISRQTTNAAVFVLTKLLRVVFLIFASRYWFMTYKVEAAGIEPACPSSQVLHPQQLSDSQSAPAAVWQRNEGSKCQCLTQSGSDNADDFDAFIGYIHRAWPYLQPHIKETIFTLIDAAVLGNQGRQS